MTTTARTAPVSAPRPVITRGHRNLLVVTAALATVLVSLGGIVCATDSSAACPDWPGCFGRVIPPANINAILEYTHRFFAGLTGLLILASAWVSYRRTRSVRAISWTTAAAILFTIAVALFGRAAVLTGLPRHLAVLDLGSALLVLTLLTVAAVVGWARHQDQGQPAARLAPRSQLATFGLGASISLYTLYVTGILASGPGSLTRCVGWPMLGIIPTDVGGGLQIVRLVLAGLAAALIVATAVAARRAHPRVAVALPALLVVEIALGLVIFRAGPTLALDMLYVTLATILYALLVALTVHAYLRPAR